MTHRFLIAPDQLTATHVTFTDQQLHQLRHVLRLRAGDRVHVFDGEQPCDWLIELPGRVVGESAQAPEPRTRLAAYPALLHRDKFESVLQKLTEIGACSITPVLTARGLVREAPDERRYARWRAIMREAAEQSGRGRVPWLGATLGFADAVASAPGARLVAYEVERECTLRQVLRPQPREVSVFVGPEGGFTPEEIAAARVSGARVVTLGPRVLRTETASPVLAALVLYELGDLSWPENHDDGR
jgi:16S rRNA (uracil1498-N3)-methyltransferase